LRVVFAGTPPFAARALDALVAAGHDVARVLTQPDRPAGRGMRLTPSAVALAAQRHGVQVLKPESLRGGDTAQLLRDTRPEAMVVAAYGLILPQAVLDIPANGCLNIHASLLPRWRGAAPIQRALLAGDSTTGISIMLMDKGLDTGAVLLERTVAIAARETSGTLTDSLAALGAALIVEALSNLSALVPRAQDESRATYAAKVAKPEARIDWALSAAAIDRQVRAFNPAPGAETRLAGEPLKIWESEPVEGCGRPGEVLQADAGRLVVACGEGSLALGIVQRPGGKRMGAAEFLHGGRISRGTLLESVVAAA
jgi:methionyl-tRNA formyltransferase